MPRYEITAPDGKKWEVTAPDGATQDQILAYAKSQWGKSQAAEPKPAPFEDPGFGKTLVIGAGRTFDRIGKGMQQLYYGAKGDDKALADLKTQAESDDAAYKPLQEARPWATGIGESLPSLVIPAGGGATLGANAIRMGVAGAIPGALEYGTALERGGRALLGGAAGVAMPAAGAVGKSALSFAEPLYAGGREKIASRLLNRVAGDDAAAVAQRLKTAAPLVPGSMPTAAQVAENGGIAALERAAAQANPSAYTERAMEQASARLSALRGIAGDDAAMKAAKAARSKAADPFFEQAKAATMQNAGPLASAVDRLPPEVLARAQRLAKLAGEPLKMGKDLPEQVVPTGLVDEFGLAITSTIPAQTSAYSGKALHYIKLALDDSLSAVGEGSLGNTEKRLMTKVKSDFLEAVDKGIPAYWQGRAAFAEASKPINRMEVGQALLDKSKPALADFGALGRETGATYANALRNGDALAAKATGFDGATLKDVLTKEQFQTVQNIAKDLARKANAQDLGRGVGSDTFQKLAMNNIAQQSGMPRLAGGLLELPGVGRATRWIYEDADKQMQGLLADALLDPKASAKLMEASKRGLLADNPKTRKLLEQSLLRSGLLGAPAAYSLAE